MQVVQKEPLKVFPTSDLVADFCQNIGYSLDSGDVFELLEQLFTTLDSRSPFDVKEHEVLDLSRFRFLSHHPVEQIPEYIRKPVYKAGYAMLVQLYVRMTNNQLPTTPGKVDHMPYLMVGNDVCLSHFKS